MFSCTAQYALSLLSMLHHCSVPAARSNGTAPKLIPTCAGVSATVSSTGACVGSAVGTAVGSAVGAGVGACVGSGVGTGVAVCAGSAVAATSTGCAVSSVAGEISTSAAGSAARVSSAAAAHPDSANTMPNATIDFFIKTTPFILGVVAYTIGLSAFNHKIYRSSCPRCRLSV